MVNPLECAPGAALSPSDRFKCGHSDYFGLQIFKRFF
jgi:hypothetical protein